MNLKTILLVALISVLGPARATQILIPMDESQKNHLKSYGIAYWALERDVEVKWLLNYRGRKFFNAT